MKKVKMGHRYEEGTRQGSSYGPTARTVKEWEKHPIEVHSFRPSPFASVGRKCGRTLSTGKLCGRREEHPCHKNQLEEE